MRTELFDYVKASDITRENIRSAFVIRLPFRLRVGSFYRHYLDLDAEHFEIALRNLVSLPEGVDLGEVMIGLHKKKQPLAVLNTDAIVVIRNPEVSEDILNRLSKWHLDKDATISTGDVFKAIKALNRFIIAYAMAAKSSMGGEEPLRLIQTEPSAGIGDINTCIYWNITILWPVGITLSDEMFCKMFELMPPREHDAISMVQGPISDLSNAELTNIDRVLAFQEESICPELAFEATSKYLHGDPKGGLLMAVAALEGAHAALVQRELMSRLSHLEKKSLLEKRGSLADEYLIRLGMSSCIRLTPYLLMDEVERPPDALIQKCSLGITIRNEIMHAKTNNRGPSIRTRSFQEISEAYSAVLKMYEYYIAALERRIETSR